MPGGKRMNTQGALPAGQIVNLIAGTFFLQVAVVAFAIAVIRRRTGVRILAYIGVWSGIYGANEFLRSPLLVMRLSEQGRRLCESAVAVIAYLVLIAATLAFLELTLGALRRTLRYLLLADTIVAALGVAWFFLYRQPQRWTLYNNLLAAVSISILFAVLAVPSLSRRFLVLSGHRVLTAGTFIFASQALYLNLSRPLHYQPSDLYSSLGFAVLLLSFGYTALERIISQERRLVAIDNELEIARRLQFSILPAKAPEVAHLRICATYLPMTSVAGDFYDFVRVDERRIGFLVADVSGHGVPAALIASMIKVAIESTQDCAGTPSEVLRRLGNILGKHAPGNLMSAAYLCIDTEARTATYSAAGHPPLLLWRAAESTLKRIESNGLLFGVNGNGAYPQREFPLLAGDRVLLYTDGVTEAENATQEAFAERKLEQVIRELQSRPASELSAKLLDEVRRWQAGPTQQDDITLLVVDVLE